MAVTATLSGAMKRLVLGRPFRSDKLSHTLLPKRIALAVFASDAMSSVAYAPQEVFLVLSTAGMGVYAHAPWIGLAVAFVLAVVVASYRQNVHAYPSGGGDFEVVTTNLGDTPGLVVASALMVDYVLTVAVSISSAVENIGSAVPFIDQNRVLVSVAIIVLLTAMNLRGVRESGAAFAIPTYAFIGAILVMLTWGFAKLATGSPVRAESAGFELVAEHSQLSQAAFVFLIARAFSSGCAALTGVEAISNGVPAFRKPKSKNAATTLLLLGSIAVVLFLGILVLSIKIGVHYAASDTQLVGAPAHYQQKTVIAQLAQAVFAGFPAGFYFVAVVTALILALAANTAFNGFPVLGSVLAQHSYLPRQFHTRGDRLAFSNGIGFLAVAATAFVVAFDAEVTALIQLYIVGVFVSFTFSQTGMIRHWTRLLKTESDQGARRKMVRSRLINATGLVMTGFVLVVVLVTKFFAGAWIAILAMSVIFAVMRLIRKHYDSVKAELAAQELNKVLPSRSHSLVLVSKVHLPTMRALAYAKATRPDTLEAITVNVDDKDTHVLVEEWEDSGIDVPLKVIASPYREVTRPVLDYVRRLRRDAPRDVVIVFIPEYVVGHWWEQILHNQSALRLKGALLFEPGVMVTSVPWQLRSSERRKLDDGLGLAPGALRRGLTEGPGGRPVA
ncbi:conserved hypothetical protein [Segniliparus rotundus DSM 44985]|uniref:Amino acid permease-associated region n=2 Tax=Segniliparus rotundus TaxID=286802 RepID=D6ZES2_SEGRD|nr:conserved hypothetical protein [Segniliparus rotundus DSM 44985]